MSSSKVARPDSGDVYAYIEVSEAMLAPGRFDWVRKALGLKAPPPVKLVEVDYRWVVDASHPHTILYRDTSGELKASWLAEWQEWVIGAVLIADKGVAMSPEDLRNYTGESEIPYHLFNHREGDKAEAAFAGGVVLAGASAFSTEEKEEEPEIDTYAVGGYPGSSDPEEFWDDDDDDEEWEEEEDE